MTRRVPVAILLLLALAPHRLSAQDQQPIVIEGGTLIDGNGGAPQSNAVVIVEGGRIHSAAPARDAVAGRRET